MSDPRARGFSTFRTRLTASMLALAVVVLTTTTTLVYVTSRRALRATRDDALFAIARAEVASAIDEPGGTLHVHDAPNDAPGTLALRDHSGYEKFAAIKSRDGRIFVHTSNLTGAPALEPDPTQEARAFAGNVAFGNARLGTTRLRAVYYPMRDADGHDLVAIIATPDAPIEDALATLRRVLYLAVFFGVAGAAFGARGLGRRLTRPLDHIAAAAETVGETSLDERIPMVSPDVELRRLTTILNDMLARLEAAFSSQRRLVADASHELRSPLANIRGTLEVALRRERPAAAYREAIALSLAEVERLGRLVNGLLFLSRTDAGQFILDRRRTDLTTLARNALAAHGARADERRVRLALAAPETLTVMADGDRIREVIDNLLDNAIRHAPPDSPVVVTLDVVPTGVRVAVADAGPGLTADAAAHVFDRFYRADDARDREHGGTGLGLAIARAIAEAHAGHLTVDSVPGHGATFTLVLPGDGTI